MSTGHVTHLITDRGAALCGETESRHWSVVESGVSCPECRALLDLRSLERSLTERRVRVTIARIMGTH